MQKRGGAMKVEGPPMYRREAWEAAIRGHSSAEGKCAGPGAVATLIALIVGVCLVTVLILIGVNPG